MFNLNDRMVNFSSLVGRTFCDIKNNGDCIVFLTPEGDEFAMYHSQDCCESVIVEDICGDLNDLLNTPILLAEEVSTQEPDFHTKAKRAKQIAAGCYSYGEGSETWTFYNLATIKGSVTIRWYGTSNGYYSESVSLYKVCKI